jgi:hypothetical protein
MVPLATAAAALALWVMVSRDTRPPAAPQVASRTESASTDRVVAAPPTAGAPAQPASSAGREGTPVAAQSRRRGEARSAAPPFAKATEPPPPALAETAVVSERPARVDERARDAAASAQPSLPPAAVPPQQTQVAQQAQAGQAGLQTQQQPPQAARPVQEPAATPRPATYARQRAVLGESGGLVAHREVTSPDPAVRWRFGAAGLVQRSADGGKTWAPQISGVTLDLSAASAPSATVCWIVGRSGVVLLTVDGSTWRRLPFPLTGDLRAVSATDGKTASVTTADGRVLTTTDGGASWR